MTQNVRSDGSRMFVIFDYRVFEIFTYTLGRDFPLHGAVAGLGEEAESENDWWNDDCALCCFGVCVGGSVLRNLEGVADRNRPTRTYGLSVCFQSGKTAR